MTCTKTLNSNDTGLYGARQECPLEIPDPINFYGLEPNSYSSFGGSVTKTAREPISSSRQNQFGVITDLDATAGFQTDLTKEGGLRWAQSFFFADVREMPSTEPINGTAYIITDVDATADSYSISSASGTIFIANDLVFASNFTSADNNGLKLVESMTGGEIVVAEALVDETPTSSAKLTGCGYQFATSDINLLSSGGTTKLTSTTTDFTDYTKLIVGGWIFLGGDATTARFANNVGYARIKSISATELVFDDTTWTPVTESGSGKTIQIFVGHILKNESDTSLIKTIPFLFERTLGEVDGEVQAEYIQGAVGNTMTINYPTSEKLTVDVDFVALKTFQKTGKAGDERLTATRIAAPIDDAYNGSNDIYRAVLKINDSTNTNASGLFQFLSSASVEVNNNVTSQKALGYLGGIGYSVGNFVASGSADVFFDSAEALQAVYNNAKCGFNIINAQGNKGIIVDIPLVSITTDGATVAKDEAIMSTLTIDGAMNDNGYTMLYEVFPYLPNIAMPVAV